MILKYIIIYNTGNVGIGTTDSPARLHVHHTFRIGNTGAVMYFGDDSSTQIYRDGTSQEIGFVTGNVDNRMIISSNGKVSIGTTNPIEQFNVIGGSISLGTYNTSAGSRYVGFYNTTGGNDCLVGMEIENTTLTGNYSQILHLRSHQFGTSHGRRLTIHENGHITIYNRLVIGGSYPAYALDIPVVGTGTIGYDLGLRYFNYDANIVASTTTLSNVAARIGGTIWFASWIASSSDIRIKEDIEDINDDSALQMILAIQPKTYKYVDKIAKGDKKVYGFIAQQIKQVLPDAVSIQRDYIPNIMLLADYDNEIITLPSQPTKVIIKLNDKIKFYDKDNNDVHVQVIEILDELTFKIKHNNPSTDFKYTDSKIFVIGTEVDDFHTISKEYIFTLNVCATQELHMRMETHNVIIKSQDEHIKELETKMVDILKYLSI